MVRISRDRKLKMVIGFVMTFVMIVSLFAGIGAIWVIEDVDRASAGVVDNAGKFTIPTTTGELGTTGNPYVVLEVVPNSNMAQFGYLVDGQEPVNINTIEALDIANRLNGNVQLSAEMVNTYRWLAWTNKDEPSYTEFANKLPSDANAVYYTDSNGNAYKRADLTEKERADYSQYGYYELAPYDSVADQYTGNYNLEDIPSERIIDGEGYDYYLENNPRVTGVPLTELSEDDKKGITYEQIPGFATLVGEDYVINLGADEYVIADNGDIYIKVEEGKGSYSDKIYKRKLYSVTFKVDGEVYTFDGKTYSFDDVKAGEKLSDEQKPADPIKPGNNFSYWVKEGETAKFDIDTEIITGNLVLVAKWNVISYPVHFNTDGGTAIADVEVEYDTPVSKPATDPEKQGYTFKGWYADAGFNTLYNFDSKIKHETTIYAKFEINKYKVKFDLGLGTGHATPVPAEQEIEYGKYATKPADPQWSGYSFQGWLYNGSEFDFTTTPIVGEITLTAKWDNMFTVSFDLNGGKLGSNTTIPSQNVVSGRKAANPGTPTKDNCEFAGWYTKVDGVYSASEYNFNTAVTSDIALYARWRNAVEFKFNVNDATAAETQMILEGTKATDPGTPVLNGYTFDGWFKEKACRNRFNFNSETITAPVTVYAKMTLKQYTVSFNIGYAGGTNPAQQTVSILTNNGKATEPSVTRNGYVLLGWKENESDTEYFDFDNTVVDHNMTLKAYWKRNAWKVTFMVRGEVKDTVEVEVVNGTAKIAATAAPGADVTAWSGYEFKFWDLYETGNSTMAAYDWNTNITQDITLKAVYRREYYTTTNNINTSNNRARHGTSNNFDDQDGVFVSFRRAKSGDENKIKYSIVYETNHVQHRSPNNWSYYNKYYTLSGTGNAEDYDGQPVTVSTTVDAKTSEVLSGLGSHGKLSTTLKTPITIGTITYTRETVEEWLSNKPEGYDSAEEYSTGDNRTYKYDIDGTNIYYYYYYDGDQQHSRGWYYDIYKYTKNVNITAYYTYEFGSAQKTDYGDHYLLIFQEDPNGKFVANPASSLSSEADYGMAYTLHTESYTYGESGGAGAGLTNVYASSAPVVTASRAIQASASVAESRRNETTETYASGAGEDSFEINLEYYDLYTTVNVDEDLPVYVDEKDGLEIGNKNYIRYVIKNRKQAETLHNYVPVRADGVGQFNWVGLTFEENKNVRESAETKYLEFFSKNLSNLTEEQKNEVQVKINNGTGGFDKLYATSLEDETVYDYYVTELTNTELFKRTALGLAYKDGDYEKGYDTSSYTFDGWYTDPYGVNPFGSGSITSDIKLYAKWVATGVEGYTTCDVTFNSGLTDATVENMPSAITNINNGSKICQPDKIPVTAGKIFDCWLDKDNNVFDFANTPITEQHMVLKARWKDMGDERFSFTFMQNLPDTGESVKEGWPADLDGNIAINGRKVVIEGGTTVYEAVPESKPVLEKDGAASDYSFAGWYLDSECTSPFSFNNAQSILEKYAEIEWFSITLYARWVKAGELPSCTVRFYANEPESALAKAQDLDKYLEKDTEDAKAYYATVDFGKRFSVKVGRRTIKDVIEIKPTLKGNVEDKVSKYKVQVITVTPEDLAKSENLGLIDRANMIVISQALDPSLQDLFNTTLAHASYRNPELFSRPDSAYTSTHTKYTDKNADNTFNDLSWAATERILSRITGMRKNSDNSITTISTCPVIYDYSIYESIIGASDEGIKKRVTTAISYNESNGSKSANAYSLNLYKLYLMTQQTSPLAVFNAYFRNRATGRISGGSFTDGYISGTNTDTYWNEYTLVPWKVIKKSDYDGDPESALSLVGFKDDVTLEANKSSISNRVFLYNVSGSKGIAKDIRTTVLESTTELSDVYGTRVGARSYNMAEVMYYLFKSKTLTDTYTHNLRVLDIEPGSNGRPADYWFWYISRFVPNYSGQTSVRQMSTAEFICNIDDLNSQYDVIFIGTDTVVGGTSKTVDYLPTVEDITIPSGITAQNYKISTNSYADTSLILMNAIKGTKPDKQYYTIDKVLAPESTTYRLKQDSETDASYSGKAAYNIIKVVNSGTDSVGFELIEESLIAGLGADLYDALEFEIVANEVGSRDNDANSIRLQRSGGRYRYYKLPLQLKIKGENEITVNITSAAVDWTGYPDYMRRDYDSYRRSWGNWYTTNYNDGTNVGPKIAFNLYFKVKGTTTSERRYEVTSKSANTEVPSTGQIFVQAGTKFDSELVYSHVGEVKNNIGDTRANQGIISSETTSVTRTVYSGNDITFKKYKEIAKYLEAGYPIILSKELFASPNSNAINQNVVASASWMYKLLEELTKSDSGSAPYYWFREDDASHDSSFRTALSNKSFHLTVEPDFPEYKDLTNPDNAGLSEDSIYINGTNRKNRTLRFYVTIDAESTSKYDSYMLRMFTDTNADGRYDPETEMLDSIQIKDTTDSRVATGIAADMVLRSGHRYEVTRTLDEEYTGIIPWKVQVLEVNSSKKPTGVYDDDTGMAAIKRYDADTGKRVKEVLYVLQLTSENGAYTNNSDRFKTNVFFPTDQEIESAYNYGSQGGISRSNWDSYFSNLTSGINGTIDVVSGTWNGSTKKNMNRFHYYTTILADFDVHFLRISVDKRSDDDERPSLHEIAATADSIKNTVIGTAIFWDETHSHKTEVDVHWDDINMLILGYADCFNDIVYKTKDAYNRDIYVSDENAVDLIKDFVEAGKTTLFTHDTTSPVNNKNDSTDITKTWGYNINIAFRDFLGMDRYGVMKNRTVSDAATVGDRIEDALGMEVEVNNVKYTIDDYTKINIANANQIKLKYDVPFGNGADTKMQVFNGSSVRTGNLAMYNSYVLAQGLTNRIVNTDSNSELTTVTQNNSGQIVKYPYTIGTSGGSYSMTVGQTHSQYYQLNMEDDEIVVWYSLFANNGSGYQNLINDGSNNYYIYNKGNITYSGVGHQASMDEDEYKLFVNTMIAAYSSRVKATTPVIKNSDKSGDSSKGIDYIYVDFDGTAQDILVDGVNQADIPIGGDVTKEGNYYFKEIEFTLKNYSVIMNKYMTVHYYPVIIDGDVRKVLYDHPLELETKRKDGGEIKTFAEAGRTVWTSTQISDTLGESVNTSGVAAGDIAFAYSVPGGMEGKESTEKANWKYYKSATDIRNSAIVGASKNAQEVESMVDYVVQIPISKNYYENVLGLSGDQFGLEGKNSFAVEIQIVMRFGRDETRHSPYVGVRDIVFMRRGMFKLD